MGAKHAQSWTCCLAVLAVPSPGAHCKCPFPGEGCCAGAGRGSSACALGAAGTYIPHGLVLLHPSSGPHCLDTLMCTPPAHEQSGPALPGKATSSPPPLPTPGVSLCAQFCCLLAALRPQGCWWCTPGGGVVSKLWLEGTTLSPQQHLCPVATVPRPAVAWPQKSPSHLYTWYSSARLSGDHCHGTRVTCDVHPVVLAARGTP